MKCEKCGAEFEGEKCPNCGSPSEKKPFFKKWWFWVIIVILVVVVAVAVAGGENHDDSVKNTTDPTYVATEPKTEKPTEPPTAKPTEPVTAAPTDPPTEKPTEDFSAVAKEYTLTAGHYKAGVDIPSGRCDVEAVSGTGNLSSSNLLSGGINAMFGIDNGSGLYTSTFKGLSLPYGTTLNLNNRLTIKLTFTSIGSTYSGRNYDESAAVALSDGNYEAGTDFASGTYKIVAVSGQGNLSSSNILDGGLNEMFGIDKGMNMYNNQFMNVEMCIRDRL